MPTDTAGLYDGTRGRTRTGTLLRAGDFESPVSTNFTTLALLYEAVLYDAVMLGREYINASALFKALYITKRATTLITTFTTTSRLADFPSLARQKSRRTHQ